MISRRAVVCSGSKLFALGLMSDLSGMISRSLAADDPCHNSGSYSLIHCIVVNGPSPSVSVSSTGGETIITFDDSEGLVIQIEAGSTDPGDPNYQAAVALLNSMNPPVTMGDLFAAVATLLAILASISGWGFILTYLGAEDIVASPQVLTALKWGFKALAFLANHLSNDPPATDTAVAKIFVPGQMTSSASPAASLSLEVYEAITALNIFGATKERIEALNQQKNYGAEMITQLDALRQTSFNCIPIFEAIGANSKSLATGFNALLTATNLPDPPGDSEPVSSASSTGMTTGISSIALPATLTSDDIAALGTTANLTPSMTSLMEKAAAALATQINGAPRASYTYAELITQIVQAFENVSDYVPEILSWLRSINSTTAMIVSNAQKEVTSVSGNSSGGKNSGTTPPKKPVNGTGPQ